MFVRSVVRKLILLYRVDFQKKWKICNLFVRSIGGKVIINRVLFAVRRVERGTRVS